MTKNKNNNLLYKNRFIVISFFATAATMLIVYLITQVFPFGDNTVLRMDLYHQYGPLFAELYDKIFSGGKLTYSWASGLGSCFLGNYFNYLSSPIGAIIVFFGHEHIPEAIGAMVLIKAALSASTFAYYLKKSQRTHSCVSVAFSMLYAFCAYMLAYYWNVMWLDAMVLLPLILFGIEKVINNGDFWLYTIALALSMFSNYYMSYMLCVFSVVYFFYYYVSNYERGAVLDESYIKKGKFSKYKNSRFYRSCLVFAKGSLLAGGIMAFALIPTYCVLQSCSATSGTFPSEFKSYFNFFDFFANHLASLTTTIRSSGDDVLPNVYCGMLTVLLAPLYFFTKSISKKKKVTTLALLSFFYISFNLNSMNYFWHGLHFPNDLPYRFSFMYSFILLIMAFEVFKRLHEFTTRQIGAIGAGIVAFIFIIDKVGSKNFDDSTAYISLIFTVVYVILLTLFKDKRYEIASLAVLLSVCVCSEIIIADTASFPNNITRQSYESDYEDFTIIKEHIDTVEQNDYYRMELTDLRTRMDPSWFGYNGVSVFSSMAYEKVADLEDRLGLMSNTINSYTYNPQTPVYNMMHSIKYLVNNETPCVLSDEYYEHMTDVNKYSAYQFKYNLPIAYVVDSDILDWNYQKDTSRDDVNPFLTQQDFFEKATGGVKNVFERVNISYVNYNNLEPFYNDLNGNYFNYKKVDTDAQASAVFSVTTQKEGNLYIYFKVSGASEESITVNSSVGTITHNAGQDCVLDLGRYNSGETISITVPFEKESGTLRFYVYTVNDEVLEKGYKVLSDGAIEISEFEDDYISGKFTAKEDSVLYTSIPYDTGWGVTIDGKAVSEDEIVEIGGALMGIKVKKGNHVISLKYEPNGLKAGTIISVACILIFLLLAILQMKKKKLVFKNLPEFNSFDNSYYENVFYLEEKAKQATLKQKNEKTPREYGTVTKEIITPKKQKSDIHKEIIAPITNISVTEITDENE